MGGFELGTVAADNTFTDGGGTWMFTPNSAEARVLDSDDENYVSYGVVDSQGCERRRLHRKRVRG